jgi:hypothetical protein
MNPSKKQPGKLSIHGEQYSGGDSYAEACFTFRSRMVGLLDWELQL